jgi:predicted anti-sigma-YlaC factor YlaD
MDCTRAREAVSARLDAEDPGVPAAMVDDHLATCAACRSWGAAAADLRRAGIGPAPTVPDQTLEILRKAGAKDRDAALRPWRGALATVAVLQLGLALPALALSDRSGLGAHATHELGCWDVALAIGFLFAALRPARAWGLVPLVGALVGSLVATSLLDLAAARTTAGGESAHVLEFLGLVFVWMLARQTRRPLGGVGLRLA